MRKRGLLALLLAALVLLCTGALAEGPQGAWAANGAGYCDLHENGTGERYDAAQRLSDLLAWQVTESGTLALYGGARDYALTWQQRDGWLTMTDDCARETVWFNATPENPDAGLAKRADAPLVGVWTQASDDLTTMSLALYDDGLYLLTDLLSGDNEPEMGLYRAVGGLLTLYPTLLGEYDMAQGDGAAAERALTLTDASGTAAVWTGMARLPFVPAEDELTGAWRAEDGALNTYAQGVLTVQTAGGESSRIGYLLSGSQLLLTDEQTGFTLRTTALLRDGALVLTARDTSGKAIESAFTKEK